QFDDLTKVPQFDQVDFVTSTNQGRFALSNRVLGKTISDKLGGDKAGTAREIFLFELARNLSFDPKQPLQSSIDGKKTTLSGPLEALLRFNPTDRLTVQETLTYSTLFKGLASSSFSGSVRIGTANNAGVTWFTNYQPEQRETVGNQVRFFGGVGLVPGR